jgi:hypothetical protein
METFPGVRHHPVVVLENAALPSFAFAEREHMFIRLQEVMQFKGISSIIFASFDHGMLNIIDELHLQP